MGLTGDLRQILAEILSTYRDELPTDEALHQLRMECVIKGTDSTPTGALLLRRLGTFEQLRAALREKRWRRRSEKVFLLVGGSLGGIAFLVGLASYVGGIWSRPPFTPVVISAGLGLGFLAAVIADMWRTLPGECRRLEAESKAAQLIREIASGIEYARAAQEAGQKQPPDQDLAKKMESAASESDSRAAEIIEAIYDLLPDLDRSRRR